MITKLDKIFDKWRDRKKKNGEEEADKETGLIKEIMIVNNENNSQ